MTYEERRSAKATLIGNLSYTFVAIDEDYKGDDCAVGQKPTVGSGIVGVVENSFEFREAHTHLLGERGKAHVATDVFGHIASKLFGRDFVSREFL